MKRVLISSIAFAGIVLATGVVRTCKSQSRCCCTGRRTKCAARRGLRTGGGTGEHRSGETNPANGGRTSGSFRRLVGRCGCRWSRVYEEALAVTPTVSYTSLYQPWAAEKAKTLSDKDDPTLKCVPVAFGTLNVSLYSVGAVGQIISTPKFVVMLQETFHGYQLIPIDGRPHRDDVPPAYRGDSVGHWEGDTLVVDTTNYTDNTWMFAEGRVSFHSDALHIVERYRRVDIEHTRNRSQDRRSESADRTMEPPKGNAGPRTVRHGHVSRLHRNGNTVADGWRAKTEAVIATERKYEISSQRSETTTLRDRRHRRKHSSVAAAAQAQVPPDIAAQLRAIGTGVCVPETAKIYKPLQQKAPYPGVTVVRDISYGAGSANDHGCFRA